MSETTNERKTSEDEVIDERDRAEGALSETSEALGGDGCWTFHTPPQPVPESGDLCLDVPELARQQMAALAAARAEVERAKRDDARAMEALKRQDAEIIAYAQQLAAQSRLVAEAEDRANQWQTCAGEWSLWATQLQKTAELMLGDWTNVNRRDAMRAALLLQPNPPCPPCAAAALTREGE